MSQHDVRCSVSHLSLLEAETALVLLSRSPGAADWQAASLPIWGIYRGAGTIVEVTEGANAELILQGFVAGAESGELQVDWAQLGLPPYSFEHIEDVLSLLACAQVHAPGAIRWGEETVSYGLLEAHLAATWMSREPTTLSSDLQVEGLAGAVFARSGCGQRLYSRLSGQSLKKRCQFGLSFLSLAALLEELGSVRGELKPAGPFFIPEPGQRERWYAEALVAFADDVEVSEALDDYLMQEQEQSELESE